MRRNENIKIPIRYLFKKARPAVIPNRIRYLPEEVLMYLLPG
jgi:hypothetical protein